MDSVFINERVRDGNGVPSGDPGGGTGTLYTDLSTSTLYVWDGSAWVTISGGGSGTPGGSNTQVQYNNAGNFGGITGATTNGTALTLVAPVLGTPASGNLSNCTAYPVSALAGLGANVATFLATPSSANLAAAVTDETGSGLLVFGTAPTFASTITIGTALGTTGAVLFKGTTSGTVTLSVADAAGTWTLKLPTADGSNGQVLQTNGAGQASWATVSGGGITIGTTTITSGTSGRVLYDNAGVVGEMTTTGTGTVLALATSPALVTPTLGVASATSVEASGQFFGKNGYSATIPAYSFTGATNTGMAQSGSGLYFIANGTARMSLVAGILQVASVAEIGWSSAASADAAANDTKMFRDAANIIAHRNDTAAQAWRLYNTFTSSTNYERLELDWITTANTLLVGCQKGSGGGTARVMNLVYGGTSTAAISVPITSGQVTFGGGIVTGGTTTQGANFEEFTEMTAPAAGAANTARLFSQDNGAGKTQLMVIFNTGAAQQVAIQP